MKLGDINCSEERIILMLSYIDNLRRYVGTEPLIVCGANIILIDNKNRIMLHKRKDNNSWGLPGGMMELGESLEENAIREVLEETGLICTELKLFNVYSGKDQYYKYPDGNQVYNVTTTYTCKNYKGTIDVDQSEGYEVRFFDIDNMPSKLSPTIIPILVELSERRGEVLR